MYGINLDQDGPKKASLDQLGQVGRRFAVFCLLGKAPLTNLDQVGPVLFPTVFRALPNGLLTGMLLQKSRDTNGSHIVIQLGGVYTTFCQEESILSSKVSR